jgi:hypothetical protein
MCVGKRSTSSPLSQVIEKPRNDHKFFRFDLLAVQVLTLGLISQVNGALHNGGQTKGLASSQGHTAKTGA